MSQRDVVTAPIGGFISFVHPAALTAVGPGVRGSGRVPVQSQSCITRAVTCRSLCTVLVVLLPLVDKGLRVLSLVDSSEL